MTNEIPLVPLLESGSNRRRSSFVLAALALSSIAVVYVVTIVQLHPSNLFGLTGDDGIYMSSAKALAEGKGYVMPEPARESACNEIPGFLPMDFVVRVATEPRIPRELAVGNRSQCCIRSRIPDGGLRNVFEPWGIQQTRGAGTNSLFRPASAGDVFRCQRTFRNAIRFSRISFDDRG